MFDAKRYMEGVTKRSMYVPPTYEALDHVKVVEVAHAVVCLTVVSKLHLGCKTCELQFNLFWHFKTRGNGYSK